MESRYQQLDTDRVIKTITKLCSRVDERFPDSGLGKVARSLLTTACQAQKRAVWVVRPIHGLRIITLLLISLIAFGLLMPFFTLDVSLSTMEFTEFVQVLEAGINDVVLIGAAIFFLATLETRIKRARALEAINELRTIAHVIDMHQLTKDPERILIQGSETASSPKKKLSRFELSRYLDYCSEMFSLTGKVAAFYVRSFDDAAVLTAVNEIESLTTSLSRKVWQKLMILNFAQE